MIYVELENNAEHVAVHRKCVDNYFNKAESESNFPLYVATLKTMHSYDFTAGRAN